MKTREIGLAARDLVTAPEKPDQSLGFRVFGYPLTPALFCLSCLLMLVASLNYAYQHRAGEAVWAISLLAIGCLLSMTPAGRADAKRGGSPFLV